MRGGERTKVVTGRSKRGEGTKGRQQVLTSTKQHHHSAAQHSTKHHTTPHHTYYTTPHHTTPHLLHHTTPHHTTPHHTTPTTPPRLTSEPPHPHSDRPIPPRPCLVNISPLRTRCAGECPSPRIRGGGGRWPSCSDRCEGTGRCARGEWW